MVFHICCTDSDFICYCPFLFLSILLLILLHFTVLVQGNRMVRQVPLYLTTSSFPDLNPSSGKCLCKVSPFSSSVHLSNLWVFQCPTTSLKHAGRWIGYAKLPLGMNYCVQGELVMMTVSLLHIQCFQNKLENICQPEQLLNMNE